MVAIHGVSRQRMQWCERSPMHITSRVHEFCSHSRYVVVADCMLMYVHMFPAHMNNNKEYKRVIRALKEMIHLYCAKFMKYRSLLYIPRLSSWGKHEALPHA